MPNYLRGGFLFSTAVLTACCLPASANVIVSNAATQNMNCSAGICAPTAASATLNVSDLENFLASGNVEIATTGTGVQAANITIDGKLSWSSASTLALVAYGSVSVNKPVSVKGAGGFSVVTDVGVMNGEFSFGPGGNLAFANLSGQLSINNAPYMLVSSVASLAAAVTANPTGRFALANKYDASKDGIYATSPIATTFTGWFEGLGNTISNLSINDPVDDSSVGLFAVSQGTLANVRLANINVTGASGSSDDSTEYVGGLVGCACWSGMIWNSSVSGVVSGGTYAGIGGLAGVASGGTVASSSSNVSVSSGSESAAGSLVGLTSQETVTDSFASGNVSGGGTLGLGGLVGQNTGKIEHSHATGTVTATDDAAYVGGLVGFNLSGTVSKSYAAGGVECQGKAACGGLVGFQAFALQGAEMIERSFATGPVTSNGGAGGLVGYAQVGTISDSYATGSVSAPLAGGLIGENTNNDGYHSVENSYSSGVVTGSAGETGGLIGNDESKSTIKRAYWDTTTSGITDKGQGAGNVANDPGIKGLSNTKLESRLPDGFNPKVWAESPAINGGLPYLIANPPPK